ncbi:MAG: hypothetical protein H0U49_07165 [Parachlamydiaceae bacterium]|nr:hypothetical protein [Parachlamydiaceae bacterium]
MIEHVVKIRSSICSQLMKSTLLKGTSLAGSGIFIFILAGIFLPPEYLTTYGLPIYAVGLGLIAYGLIPYRRLTALEKCPNELWYQEKPETSATQNENIPPSLDSMNHDLETKNISESDLNFPKKDPEKLPTMRLISYRSSNKEIFTFPVDYIDSFSFVDSPSDYGISICLVHPLPKKIAIHDKTYATSTLQNTNSNSENNKTLFLPYFSKRAYYQLTELIDIS